MKVSWSQRAAAFFQKTPPPPTDEGDEICNSSVSSVRPQGVFEKTAMLTQAANDPQPALPDPSNPAVATCSSCRHLLPRGTCARPIEAGLIPAADGYGLAWPPEGHGAGCPAFEAQQAPPAAQERAYKLSAIEADAAHAQPWTEAQIRLFNARTVRCGSLGFTAADADDVAERLHMRDATGDTRVACAACRHYERGRCAQHRAAGLQADAVGRELAALLQHCPGFAPVTSHPLATGRNQEGSKS